MIHYVFSMALEDGIGGIQHDYVLWRGSVYLQVSRMQQGTPLETRREDRSF